MRFEFKTKDLLLLYTEEKDGYRFPAGVVDSFFDAMAIIDSAATEKDIRAFKSLHFEKLSGTRSGQYSVRLNKQFRLIIEIIKDTKGKLIWIIEIVDYH